MVGDSLYEQSQNDRRIQQGQFMSDVVAAIPTNEQSLGRHGALTRARNTSISRTGGAPHRPVWHAQPMAATSSGTVLAVPQIRVSARWFSC
jgi:hypothetical protein